MGATGNGVLREPWNKGKLVGQKAPFKLKDIWAPRVRLQMEGRVREPALFNPGIDSKLRGSDLVGLKGPGRVPWRPSHDARNRRPSTRPSAPYSRDHASRSRRRARVDQTCWGEAGDLLVS
jgi:hypothetical protein